MQTTLQYIRYCCYKHPFVFYGTGAIVGYFVIGPAFFGVN